MLSKELLALLMKTPVGEKLRQATAAFERAQEVLYALATDDNELARRMTKIGSVLTFALLNRIFHGARIKDFGREDWAEIANEVAEYAICMEDGCYSAFIFALYANYIEVSAASLENRCSEKTVSSIQRLSDGLRYKTELFRRGEIKEVAYTEDCLWLCLEAMCKLLATTVTIVPRLVQIVPVEDHPEHGEADGDADEEPSALAVAEDLSQAIVALAFEYGRCQLLQQEQAELARYLEQLSQLDCELDARYEAFVEELNAGSARFYELLDNAFSPNFRESYLVSIDLAREAGVPEDEIIDSMDKLDAFFLG